MKHKRAILITGTVVPNSNYVAHADPEKRVTEYCEALEYYAKTLPSDDIYFLENSEYDFSSNREFSEMLNRNKIILLRFPKSGEFDKGKGYQEFEMLDKALEVLSGGYQSFIKLTGRYKVNNILRITKTKVKGIMIDCHKKPAVAQTNVFYCETEFYELYLKGLYAKADDSKLRFIEHVVYDTILKKEIRAKIQLFPENPLITGVSGSYGTAVGRNKIKMRLRNIERNILKVFGVKQFLIEY